MSIFKIAQIGVPILRGKAKMIPVKRIRTVEIQQLIDGMTGTLQEEGGVGLAAPQVYESKQIIIIQSKPTKESFRKVKIPLTIIINPKIVRKSREFELDWEGCLSVFEGNLRGLVPRARKISLEGYNRKGEKIRLKATSFKARVLQHEIDHLQGVVFLERMRKRDLRSLARQKEWVKYYKDKWPRPILI